MHTQARAQTYRDMIITENSREEQEGVVSASERQCTHLIDFLSLFISYSGPLHYQVNKLIMLFFFLLLPFLPPDFCPLLFLLILHKMAHHIDQMQHKSPPPHFLSLILFFWPIYTNCQISY